MKNIFTAVTVGIMCLSLASCKGSGDMYETVYDTYDTTETVSTDWEDDPTIGMVKVGCYKRTGISIKDETYEEMLKLREIENKGYLVVCDDGTAYFEFDGEKTDYLYDKFNFYPSEDTEQANGIPYVYIGGRLILNDGTTITQFLKLPDEGPESYPQDGGKTDDSVN